MKKATFMALAAIVTMMISTTANAQDNQQRKSKEELVELQAKHIAVELKLDDATTKRFAETFCSLKKQVWEIEAKPTKVRNDMSDTEAEQAIKARFEHSQKILDIRRNGYDLYRQFLTPKQIETVYQLEKQGMKRMAHHKKEHAAAKNKAHHPKRHKK